MRCIVVGHVTRDVISIGGSRMERIGGGAYYSALALSKFCKVHFVTSFGNDLPLEWVEELEEKFRLDVTPAERTTTFELAYLTPHVRRLFVRAVAEDIGEVVPRRGTVIFNPVIGEVSPSAVVGCKRPKFIDVQGFVRKFDETGEVSLRTINASFLNGSTAVHADFEEMRHLHNLDEGSIDVILVSNGSEQGVARFKGEIHRFKPPEVRVRETTGAGDVFLGAFAGFYMRETPLEALRRGIAFTALFLSKRNVDFTLDEVEEECEKVRLM